MNCTNRLNSGYCAAARMANGPTFVEDEWIDITEVKCPYDGDTQKCLNAFIDFSLKNSDKKGWCD